MRVFDRLRRVRPFDLPAGRRTASWVPYVLVLLAAAASLAGLAIRPAAGAPQQTVDYVIVAGAAGLRWDDLDPQTTPALWQEASKGSIGWLSVRSAQRATCPSDGWLTLGAGNYAASPRASGSACQAPAPELTQPDAIGANITNQRNIVRDNQDKLPYGAVPGSLAESVRCTVAVGPGAAIAAARPFGRVDSYAAQLPEDPTTLLSDCVLSFVDLGTISGSGATRKAAVVAADAVLARVVAARPARSLLLVAGVSDTDQGSRLHVAIAEGEGWNGGWLTSTGTGRDGYLQLIDLAPTVLTALGKSSPEKLFAGRAATVVPGKPDNVADAVQGTHDADRRASAQRGVAAIFFAVVAILDLLLYALIVPVMVRARRHSRPRGPALPSGRVVTVVELALTATALAIPAALLADASPWWRGGHPAWAFGLVTGALIIAGTALVRASPRYRRTLWPLAAVSGIGAVVVGMDLLTGAQLQLNGVAGYSATTGARYAGVGGVGLGVFVAGLLVLAGCLAQLVAKTWRPVIFVLLGGVGVVMVGSPYLGADPVGAIAVTAGVCVAAAISTGGWLTFPRFAWAAFAGLGVTIGFAVMDLRRPELEQGSLGRFLTQLADGTGGPAVQRAAAANGETLLQSPLTILALIGIVMLAFCQFSPWGGLNRLFGLHPAIRAAGAGTTVATAIAGVLGGSALTVAGAAAAFAVPVAVLTALRVLLHAADRTRPEGETDGPGGPALRKSDEDHLAAH
ncbi:hypothetical protein BJ973_000041 [Actinoplanes tereljensis]|uniref:Uncharacterized protein n=1 Tax=Paractinoplanes tereljensis TaxID=571912 RepID=A0A919P082_9ACTN|nr:hypothetical protein [Actinoplanes tereljensis]GIF26867.1 hypothetical protein Ate02nite_95970 [Actinoplanes tereljensis]